MKFGLLMTDIPVYVSGKFEMYIFKIALVINENVRFAFLYVLSMYYDVWTCWIWEFGNQLSFYRLCSYITPYIPYEINKRKENDKWALFQTLPLIFQQLKENKKSRKASIKEKNTKHKKLYKYRFDILFRR